MAKGGAHLPPKNSKRSAGTRVSSSGRHSASSSRPAAPSPKPSPTPGRQPTARETVSRTAAAPESRSDGSRKKKRRSTGFPLWPIVVVLAAVMIFAAWKLIDILLGYRRDRASYDALRDIAIVQLTPAPVPVEIPDEQGQIQIVEVPSEIPISVDWDTLRQTNPDIIAWLYCPDSMINYPVVQTADNETYLDRSFEGGYSAAGTLFADAASVPGIRQSHLIIYGHNMKDNSMFGTLKNYGDPAYYEKHPILYLLAPEQSYRIDLMACQTLDAVKANYPTYFSTDEDYSSFIGRMTAAAYWVNPEAANIEYQLVTLSTCTSSDAQRLVLQGILVPIQ